LALNKHLKLQKVREKSPVENRLVSKVAPVPSLRKNKGDDLLP